MGTAKLIGTVDGYSSGYIYGWARDEGMERSVSIAVCGSRGQLLGIVDANLYRRDLAEAGVGTGNYGFRFRIPPELTASESIITAGRRPQIQRVLRENLAPVKRRNDKLRRDRSRSQRVREASQGRMTRLP